jgi:hypothetical protein
MKACRTCITAIAISIAFPLAPAASAVVVATSKGAGADAEVRDHQPAINLGTSSELATRILDNFPAGASDVNDRFSAMYMKFDITGQFDVPNQVTSLRLTYRNSNLTPNRVHDPTPPGNNMDFRTGLAFYGLDRDHPGNSWSEATITYSNAPGIASDGNNGTKDYDFVDPDGGGPLRAPLTPLGVALFPEVPPQNRLPVGGALLFSSDALNNFLVASLNARKTSVTIVAGIVHDGKVPITDWKNFSYLFNPKEQTTLTTDVGYDSDTTNPNNPLGSPWSAASNAEDASGFSPFSPQLIFGPSGDFNSDGLVNAADYVQWRKTSGSQVEYDVWRTNFGRSFAGSASKTTTVAEPHRALPWILTAILAYLHNTRRGAREGFCCHALVSA